jgi:hypothetical protein
MITNVESGSAAVAGAVIDGVTAASDAVLDWFQAAGLVSDPDAEAAQAQAEAEIATATASALEAQSSLERAQINQQTAIAVVGILAAVYLLKR